jgi:hypothetical protein
MAEKNMVEDALFQIKNLEESLKKNAQGILSSTMRKEINSLVKESLMEQEEIIEPAPEDVTAEDPTMMPDEAGMEMDPSMETEPGAEDPEMMGDEMTGMEPEEDETIDMRGASDSEVIRVFKAMGDNDGVVVTRDNNIITLTDDDDEYIIKLNESMENFDETAFDSSMEEELNEFYMDFEDEEEDMDFEDEEEDMDFEDEEEDMDFEDEEEDMDFEEEDMDGMSFKDEEYEGIMYEIEMDDTMSQDFMEEDDMDFEDDDMEDMDSEDDLSIYESKKSSKGMTGKGPKFKYGQVTDYKMPKQKEGTKGVGMGKAKFTYKDGENLDGEYRPIKKGKKVETKEASRTYGNGGLRGLRKGITPNRNLKEEVVELRTKNGEYRKALDLFRTKLNEVAVFNSNLAYATRLFTEHSTTKQEKINILRRFDDVETLKESKSLYRVVKSELSNNSLTESTSLNESIERTVNKTASSGSAVSLIESKTYENPQFLRMKDLMGKL